MATLEERAEEIRAATLANENSAQRVGQFLKDLVAVSVPSGTPAAGLVPTAIDGTGATQWAPGGSLTQRNENAVALTPSGTLQANWIDALSGVLQFHGRMPRASVKCVVDSNQSTTSCSTSVGGLSGTRLLRINDVAYFGAQTTASQNGFYRVYSVSGSTASIVKLGELDVFFAASGIYVEVMEGTYGGQIRKMLTNGVLSTSITMPSITRTLLRFDDVQVDDFVLSGDDTSPVTGNWYPMLRRAQAAALQRQADIWFSSHDYRFTQRPVCWTLSRIRGRQVPQTAGLTQYARVLLDGCGGFFGPYPGDVYETVTYDAGIRAGIRLENLNVVMVNGSDRTAHYGARARGFVEMRYCNFQQIYGNGFEADTVGTGGNTNSDSLVNVTWTTCGKNGIYLAGGDSNNILFLNCRSTNHGQGGYAVKAPEYEPAGLDTFPGNDWGVRNQSFLGCTFINCEFSSGHVGGIYDSGTFTEYVKCYTEGGTNSDIRTAGVRGGNLQLRGVYIDIPAVSVTFANSGSADTITLTAGTWAALGVIVGDRFTITGSASNNITTGPIASIVGAVATFGSTTSLVNEGPITVDIVGTNTVARTSVNNPSPTTRLPLDKPLSDNAFASSGHRYDDGTGSIAVGVSGGMMDRGLTGAAASASWHTQIGTGGNSNAIATGYGTTSASVNVLETLPGNGLGAGQKAFRKGVVLGDPSVAAVRVTSMARASLPATGVPDTGAPGSANSGAYPAGSVVFEPTPGAAAWGYEVLTNSGSAAYNLTWGAIPNGSPTPVTLTNASVTRGVTDGGLFVLPTGTLTANHVLTLSTTSALQNDRIQWDITTSGGFTYTIGGVVVPANTSMIGFSRYNAGAWTTKLWTVP